MSITSGLTRTTQGDALQKVITATYNAALIGWNKMNDIYAPKIAREFGGLRREFRQAGVDHINSQRGARRIHMNPHSIYSRLVSALDYSEHHIEVGPRGDFFYAHPTVDGTEPIKAKIWVPIFVRESQAEFTTQLRLQGFKVTRRKS